MSQPFMNITDMNIISQKPLTNAVYQSPKMPDTIHRVSTLIEKDYVSVHCTSLSDYREKGHIVISFQENQLDNLIEQLTTSKEALVQKYT